VTARPPKRLAQLRSVSHALVSTLQKHRSIKVKIDTIWQAALQRQLGVSWYGGAYVVNQFKKRCITKKQSFLSYSLTIFTKGAARGGAEGAQAPPP